MAAVPQRTVGVVQGMGTLKLVLNEAAPEEKPSCLSPAQLSPHCGYFAPMSQAGVAPRHTQR